MNNKGFAITGILYTLFALFMMIILTALVNLRFKQTSLSKTTETLEDDYALIHVATIDETNQKLTTINETNGYKRDIDNNFSVPYDGKYVFVLYLNEREPLECTTYLKKTTKIPPTTDNSENIVFIPKDCNGDLNNKYTINIGTSTNANNNMYLKEVYKYKGSD